VSAHAWFIVAIAVLLSPPSHSDRRASPALVCIKKFLQNFTFRVVARAAAFPLVGPIVSRLEARRRIDGLQGGYDGLGKESLKGFAANAEPSKQLSETAS
jgi:hypothetical protein